MAFDGVFAFQGKDHITASQLGRIVEGVAGKGRYVLPTLNQMTAEMQTANKVRVGTGDLVMDGRVVTNEAAVDLTVESGTSGYKRNDLVVCRYTKNASTGVEKFAAEVVKGTPTTGTAADPKVTEGDISSGSASAVMPLWRIPLDGITPGAPVRIAPVASTLKTLGDSVSHSRTKVSHSGGGSIRLCRFGPIAVMELYAVPVSLSGSWGTCQIGTVPSGFRPRDQQRATPHLANFDNAYSLAVWVKPAGEIYAANMGGTGFSGAGEVSCTMCWECA